MTPLSSNRIAFLTVKLAHANQRIADLEAALREAEQVAAEANAQVRKIIETDHAPSMTRGTTSCRNWVASFPTYREISTWLMLVSTPRSILSTIGAGGLRGCSRHCGYKGRQNCQSSRSHLAN